LDNTGFSLASLLIVTALGLLVPLIVTRIRAVRIPIVVGEIIAGVVVGKSGFNIIQNSEWLQLV
jgi:Kef-type K+ transport system membrane component KefB